MEDPETIKYLVFLLTNDLNIKIFRVRNEVVEVVNNYTSFYMFYAYFKWLFTIFWSLERHHYINAVQSFTTQLTVFVKTEKMYSSAAKMRVSDGTVEMNRLGSYDDFLSFFLKKIYCFHKMCPKVHLQVMNVKNVCSHHIAFREQH